MDRLKLPIEFANRIVDIDQLCPAWIRDGINRPYRERIDNAMKRVQFIDLDALKLDVRVSDEFNQKKTEIKRVNRQIFTTNTDTSILLQNFGNNVHYMMEWDNQTRSVQKAFYIDSVSRRAVDILSLDPTIDYQVTLTPSGKLDVDRWEADEANRKVFLSGDTEYVWTASQETQEKLNMIAPVHEIGHIFQHDVMRSQPLFAKLPVMIKNWAEAFRGTIASGYKLVNAFPDLDSNHEIEMTRAAYLLLKDYHDDDRGSSKERYASLTSLIFIRLCQENGVELSRALSQSEIVLIANDMLHSSTL